MSRGIHTNVKTIADVRGTLMEVQRVLRIHDRKMDELRVAAFGADDDGRGRGSDGGVQPVLTDGSTPLTADWDAGDRQIRSNDFRSKRFAFEQVGDPNAPRNDLAQVFLRASDGALSVIKDDGTVTSLEAGGGGGGSGDILADGSVDFTGAETFTAGLLLDEQATPSDPVQTEVHVFARDNTELGSGYIDLVVRSAAGEEYKICTLLEYTHTNTLAFNLIE